MGTTASDVHVRKICLAQQLAAGLRECLSLFCFLVFVGLFGSLEAGRPFYVYFGRYFPGALSNVLLAEKRYQECHSQMRKLFFADGKYRP